MNQQPSYTDLAIGIDIGGSKTAIGVVNLREGTVLDHQMVPTPTRDGTGASFLADLRERALAMRNADRPSIRIDKIGIGVCEVVDRLGEIGSAHRVEISKRQVRDAFGEFAEIAIESDVRAAATAEARFGVARGRTHWIYVNAGTGISSVVMNGEDCHIGAHGWVYGLGMSPANLSVPEGVDRAFVEEISGGAGLVRIARKKGLHVSTVRELFSAAASKSDEATIVLSAGGRVLGGAIAWLVNIFDPEVVVVGGGVASNDSPYWQSLTTAVEANTWYAPAKQVPVLRSALSTNAGLIGAALSTGRD